MATVSEMRLQIVNKSDLVEVARWAEIGQEASPSLPSLVVASSLYTQEFDARPSLFENLLWNGLTILIARPKSGKSWLTLQLSISVAGGPEIFGTKLLEKGQVLYGAFEEPPSRTASRLKKLAPSGDWTKNLHFLYEILPLMGGGSDQLSEMVEQLKPRLVVLDTFTAFVKTATKGGNDVFRNQHAEISTLRKLAERFNTAVILVHHTRKGNSDGAIEAVAGTGGIAAAVDTLWHLKRKREGEATLDLVGRETEEATLALKFSQEPLGWSFLGDYQSQTLTSERQDILRLLKEDGPLTPAQIAAELEKSRPAVRMLLMRMKEDGQVQKHGTKYQL